MQRIETLLQKITEMSARGNKNTVIDIDLMLDYVKVVYADLLEMRSRMVFTAPQPEERTEPVAATERTPERSSPVTPTITHEPITDATQAIVESLEQPSVVETTIAAPVTEVITAKEEEPIEEQPKEEKKEEIKEEGTAPPAYNFPIKHDIRKVIGINDKYLFISELFQDNKETYEKALDEINKLNTYDEALEWLKENMLFTSDADGENGTTQLFYDTLGKFFSER